MHFFAIPLDGMQDLMMWFWIQAVLVVAAISIVKLSIGFFLLRLSKKTLFQRFVLGLIGELSFDAPETSDSYIL